MLWFMHIVHGTEQCRLSLYKSLDRLTQQNKQLFYYNYGRNLKHRKPAEKALEYDVTIIIFTKI